VTWAFWLITLGRFSYLLYDRIYDTAPDNCRLRSKFKERSSVVSASHTKVICSASRIYTEYAFFEGLETAEKPGIENIAVELPGSTAVLKIHSPQPAFLRE
jgi:hypothetical protein